MSGQFQGNECAPKPQKFGNESESSDLKTLFQSCGGMLLRVLLFFLSALLTSGTASCADPEASETKPGYYRNDYFGFSLVFPKSWVVQCSKPHSDGKNESLLVVSNATKAPNRASATLCITTEGIDEAPSLASSKTAEEYVSDIINRLGDMNSLRDKVVEPPRKVTLGGRQFWRADVKHQGGFWYSYYGTLFSKGIALRFLVDGDDAEKVAEANHVLEKIHFDKPK